MTWATGPRLIVGRWLIGPSLRVSAVPTGAGRRYAVAFIAYPQQQLPDGERKKPAGVATSASPGGDSRTGAQLVKGEPHAGDRLPPGCQVLGIR